MFKTILATSILAIAMSGSVSAATMAPMKKMDHGMAMKKMDKCKHGMHMMKDKCMTHQQINMMKKHM